MARVTRPKKITKGELLDLFDRSVRVDLEQAFRHEGTTHVVVFENLQMDSSAFGERTAVRVGPGCSYSLQEALDNHLYDLPSQRQYPVAYAPTGQAE